MVDKEPIYDLCKLLAYCRSVVETERCFAQEWKKRAKETIQEVEFYVEASERNRNERYRQQCEQLGQIAYRRCVKWKSWADALEQLLNTESQRTSTGVG